jgi:hypothetical protein
MLFLYPAERNGIMKDISNFKCIAFLCDPIVYKYLQGARNMFYRTQSQQINHLLELALELREEDEEVGIFRNWLKKQKEQETQQKEGWLEKELGQLEQGPQK